MKSFIIALSMGCFAFLIPKQSQATHAYGGQIYWDAVGNNEYVFYIDWMISCSAGFFPGPIDITTNAPGHSSGITLSHQWEKLMSPDCGPCSSSSWQDSHIHYRSDTVYIPPASAGTPWNFYVELSINYASLSNAANPTTVKNVAVAEMYRAGANKSSGRSLWMDYLNPTGSQIQTHPYYPQGDSSYTQLVPLWTGNSYATRLPMAYAAGYSATNPISPSDNFYEPTGTLTFNSTVVGRFGFCVELNTFVGGELASRTYPGGSVYINQPNNNNNSAPNVSVQYGSMGWSTQDSARFSTTAQAGDTVELFLFASDFDLNPNMVPQVIKARLDSQSQNGMGSNLLMPIAPQSGLSAASTNNVKFEWILPAQVAPGRYSFLVSFTDDNCRPHAVRTVYLDVTVPFSTSSVQSICAGGSTTLSASSLGSTYFWSPMTGLSNANSPTTIASPTVTTTYILYIDGAASEQVRVEVGQPAHPIVTVPNPLEIELINPSDFLSHYHTYYFVPFAMNDTVVTAPGPGLYNVMGLTPACTNWSDSVLIGADSSATILSLTHPDTGIVLTLNAGDSFEQVFAINEGGSFFSNEMIWPGLNLTGKTGTASLSIQSSSMMSAESANAVPMAPHSASFNWSTAHDWNGRTVTARLTVDSGSVQVRVYTMGNFPQAMTSASGFSQVLSSEAVIDNIVRLGLTAPLVFKATNAVSLPEWDQQLRIYPNPVHDNLHVQGLEPGINYAIIDMMGRNVLRGSLPNDGTIDVSPLTSGVYMVRFEREGEVIEERVVVE